MILKIGNMWDSPADLHLVTANSYVRGDGALVMGRGAAQQCQLMYDGCNKSFGRLIRIGNYVNGKGGVPFYGLLLHPHHPIGLFQVKWNWFEKADIDLIRMSRDLLYEWVLNNPTKTVALNFPGIGNGGLKISQVMPLIRNLPDSVEVWRMA